MTGTQMSIIDFLTHFPGNSCDQHQIENEFGIKRSTTTVLLQRMAKKNLIERYPSPEDRRQKIVTLTAEGQKLSSDVSAYITQYEEKLKADFSEQDISKIKRFLSTMIKEK
nr:MarR family transcriptional regulator [Limosilactobacillus reuteri]